MGNENAATDRRLQAAREIREQVARYGISESELRRAFEDVDRERQSEARQLQLEAERGFRRERQRALHIARQLIEFWGIGERELSGVAPAVAPPVAPDRVKYRHPVSGESWNGAGEQPDWLRRALASEGYRVAELQPETIDFERAAQAARQFDASESASQT